MWGKYFQTWNLKHSTTEELLKLLPELCLFQNYFNKIKCAKRQTATNNYNCT